MEEFTVRIRMLAAPEVSDELLEELAIGAEEALSKHAVAPGASASANFSERSIELDLIVEAGSLEELHQRVGEIAQIALESASESEPKSPVSFASSATSSAMAFA